MCKKCKISKTTRIAIIVGVVILALWAGSWWWISQHFQCHEERGTFGDMFGAINALFSGLAFAGLIVTLLYQKEELALQRDELRETREEMARQRTEFEEQNKTLKRQRFENTFFNMLSLQQEIVANLSYDEVERVIDYRNPLKNDVRHTSYRGRTIFREIYLNLTVSTTNQHSYNGIRQAIRVNTYAIYSEISSTTRFDHYFRHLYRIYKYVDTSDLIANNERYDYACIIRSQLSDYELVMLFYNCLTANGRAKFKPLIERYAIFNNLRQELLAKSEDKSLYAEKAYDRSAE